MSTAKNLGLLILALAFLATMLAVRHSSTAKPCANWMDYGTPASNTEAQDHVLYAGRENCK